MEGVLDYVFAQLKLPGFKASLLRGAQLHPLVLSYEPDDVSEYSCVLEVEFAAHQV